MLRRGGRLYKKLRTPPVSVGGRGQAIEKDIVRRVRREDMKVPWLSFWTRWGAHDDRDKIQQVMDRAGAAVTKLVCANADRHYTRHGEQRNLRRA